MPTNPIDYGPLASLIGTWKGNKGLDIAPEPDGSENNPYYETISYEAIGDVTNAESQVLTALHYRQIVQRKSNDKVFHHQTGYWMWDAKTETVMHSLTIPRAVSVLASGACPDQTGAESKVTLTVRADINDPAWTVLQSPFMHENARTTAFQLEITVDKGVLAYMQTTIVDIYGKPFEHTDQNELRLQ